MDPLTALGLASAILQVVDFSSKLISGAKHAYSSASGTTAQLEDSQLKLNALQTMTRRLDVRVTGAHLSKEDQTLLALKEGCAKLIRDIEDILQATRVKKPGPKRASLEDSFKAMVMARTKKIATLEGRLDKYRSQIVEHITSMMSDDVSRVNRLLGEVAQKQVYYADTTRAEICQTRSAITTAISDLKKSQEMYNEETISQTLSLIQKSLVKLAEATQDVTKEDGILAKLWHEDLGRRERTIETPHKTTSAGSSTTMIRTLRASSTGENRMILTELPMRETQ